ncbi:MAG: PAS domain-containing protein [Albidovulum sp.]
MQFPCISEVRGYWEALRDGRQAPFRSEIDPRGIERSLEYAFVLERVAPQVARFRLAGMHLSDLMGMEVRGMPITAFFAPNARAQLAQSVEAVFSGPNTAEILLEAETAFGKPSLQAKLLILPLRSDLGDVTRALGCLVSDGQIGRTPRRFNISECRMEPIPSGAGSPDHTMRAPVTHGFSEPAAPFLTGQIEPIRSRGHLHLVVSDVK